MDGDHAAWCQSGTDSGIYYEYLGQPDLSVGPQDITFSNPSPLEGDTLSATVTVHNLTNVATTADLVVRLYDGDPDGGGTYHQLGSDVKIVGGLASLGQATATFSGISFDHDGPHSIYTRVVPLDNENPANNKASTTLNIQDSDTQGPAITNVTCTEYHGDGDGIIGSDEQIKISWTLNDPSGVASTQLLVNGTSVQPVVGLATGNPTSADCYAIVIPQGTGVHTFAIQATDADDSPASSEYDGTFNVVASEEITILYGGQAIGNNASAAINVGRFRSADPNGSIVFTVRNDGQQTLYLNGVTVTPTQGSATAVTPPTSVLPGATTNFAVLPDTHTAGTFAAQVSLTNSDGTNSPFSLAVTGTVDAPPVINSVTAAPGTVVRPNGVTLTAVATDPDGTVSSVAFYQETNGTPGLQVGAGGDAVVGQGTSGTTGWTLSLSTSGVLPGTYTYYAKLLTTMVARARMVRRLSQQATRYRMRFR